MRLSEQEHSLLAAPPRPLSSRAPTPSPSPVTRARERLTRKRLRTHAGQRLKCTHEDVRPNEFLKNYNWHL